MSRISLRRDVWRISSSLNPSQASQISEFAFLYEQGFSQNRRMFKLLTVYAGICLVGTTFDIELSILTFIGPCTVILFLQ